MNHIWIIGVIVILSLQPASAAALAGPPLDVGNASAPEPTTPPGPEACTHCRMDLLAGLEWLDEAPLEQVAIQARRLIDEAGGSRHLAPDQIPGHDRLSEDDARALWRIWVGISLTDLWAGRGPGILSGSASVGSADQPAPAALTPSSTSKEPFGMRSLWRIEGHGVPQEVLPADDEGGFYLVTSRAVLRFPGPGEDPSWMVKPDGYVSSARSVDVNGDGVRDLVMGMRGNIFFFFGIEGEQSGDSIVIIDGATGKALLRGLSGDDFLADWTLTDVDGDGNVDLLGLDYAGQTVIAAKTDGTVLWRQTPEGLPEVNEPMVGAAMALYDVMNHGFGDVDGDGVEDIVFSSSESIDAFLPAGTESASEAFVAAYSGTDASRIWITPADLPARGSALFLYVDGVADVDGDGNGDVILSYFEFRFEGVAVVTMTTMRSGMLVIGGSEGGILVRDDSQTHTVFPFVLPPVTVPINEAAGFSDSVADLDGDGAAEVLTIEEGATEFEGALVGRTVGPVVGGPSGEAYRVPFEIPAYDDGDAMVVIRDIDGDGVEEYVVALIGAYANEDGELTGMESRLLIFDSQELTTVELPRLTAFYDVDPVNGNAYGWTIEDDRFVPLDAEGAPVGEGMRLVISPYARTQFDITSDGVPDILLQKSMGFTWVDGRDGSVVEDVPRPANRYLRTAVPDGDKLYVVETDWTTGDTHLTELVSRQPIWTLPAEDLEDGYVYTVADFNGDGSLDVLVRTWGRGDEPTALRVLDVAKGETIWEKELTSPFIGTWIVDLDPSRPGKEIVMTVFAGTVCTFSGDSFSCERDDSVETGVSAHSTSQEEPLWQFLNTDDVEYGYAGEGGGLALVREYGEGENVLRVIDGSNGTMIRAVEDTEKSRVSSVALDDVLPRGGPELLLVHEGEGTGEGLEYRLQVTDARDGTAHSEFIVATDFTGDMGYVYLGDLVGDWTGDGWNDLAATVFGQPVVFDVNSGKRLAAASEGTWIAFAEDFNKDGIPELGVMDDTLRLRLFTYDQAVNQTAEDEGDVRVLADPTAPQTDAGAEDFFDGADTPGPSPLAILIGLLTALAAAVGRRRR